MPGPESGAGFAIPCQVAVSLGELTQNVHPRTRAPKPAARNQVYVRDMKPAARHQVYVRDSDATVTTRVVVSNI